jgi:hypothetical protein
MFLSWFIIDAWHYQTFWYIWLFCGLAPALMELVAIVRAIKRICYGE